MRYFFVIFFTLLFFSCNKADEAVDTIETSDETNDEEEADNSVSQSPNILFIIADDLGKDAMNGFTEGNIKPTTPNLDVIRTNGLSFSNFWVYPTCTPTRASIITGKHSLRTNVKWVGDDLSTSETILHQYIKDETNDNYATSLIGKWHLSGNNANTINPETFGIDYYAGLFSGAVGDYYNWQFVENSSTSTTTEYTTTKFTDLAIDWIQEQDKPWFTWLAYNAPHTPFHVPPNEMHSQGNLPEYVTGMDPIPYYMAAIEAMDFQIGRLLDTLSEEERENTVVIFIGDNGTPNQVVQRPYSVNGAKGTLYQGGINTPLFISGAGVSRTGVDENLIVGTDLFTTIAAIAGVSVNELNDSKSFKELLSNEMTIRDYQYAEMDDGTTHIWTISDGTYKLLVNSDGEELFYDLINDPYESSDLMMITLTPEAELVKNNLLEELVEIRN